MRAITLAVALLVASPAAMAQSVCSKHADFKKFLGEQHQEVVRAIGLAGTGTMVEIYVSKEGSWTLAATNTEGVTCMVMAGENFEMIPLPLPAKPNKPVAYLPSVPGGER